MTITTLCNNATRLSAMAICVAALGTGAAAAQGGGMGGGPRGGGQMGGQMSPEAQQARMDSMTKAVGLTDDQVVKVKALNADTMKQMMDLRASGGDPQEMRPKMTAIREGENTKIKAMLTDDQKPKYDAWLATQPRGGRPGGQGGAPPPPPAPPQ